MPPRSSQLSSKEQQQQAAIRATMTGTAAEDAAAPRRNPSRRTTAAAAAAAAVAAAAVAAAGSSRVSSSRKKPPSEAAAAAAVQASSSTSAKTKATRAKTTASKTARTKRTTTPKAVTPPTTKAAPSSSPATVEKRVHRYRPTCPAKLYDRILRAKTQRLYLLHCETTCTSNNSSSNATAAATLSVLGSTGNVYKVTLDQVPSCSCPDFARQHDSCKHLLFVMLKVLALQETNPLVFQRAFLTSELDVLLERLDQRCRGMFSNNNNNAIVALETVRQTYQSMLQSSAAAASSKSNTPQKQETNTAQTETTAGVKRHSIQDDGECPICFDSFEDTTTTTTAAADDTNETVVTYCRAACGMNFHTDCIQRWLGAAQKNKCCPNCRQPWIRARGAAATKKRTAPPTTSIPRDSQYLNLGQLQGQSPYRDTSTYHSYSRSRYN